MATPARTSRGPASTRTRTYPRPVVTTISPSAGASSGGTAVTSTASGLAGATTVSFGSLRASSTVSSSTPIAVTAPAGTPESFARCDSDGSGGASNVVRRVTLAGRLSRSRWGHHDDHGFARSVHVRLGRVGRPHHKVLCPVGPTSSMRRPWFRLGGRMVTVSRPVGGILSAPPEGGTGVAIHLSGLPGERLLSEAGRAAHLPRLALLRVGFTEPAGSPRPLVRSYRTVSPLPVRAWRPAIGGLLSVALSCGSPRLAVSQHPALRSPDLPRHGPRAARAAATRPTHRQPSF